MNSFSEAIEKCCRLISEEKMLLPGECVVAGVSGGADSVFLFHVLLEMAKRLKLHLVVAHLNHGLRIEAKNELAFVRDLCRSHGVIFHGAVISREVVAHIAGKSIEMAARERRKRFLKAVAKSHGADKIALGHTESDHTETVLMNIHRGTGLRGLAGIRQVRDGIIRPLIAMEGSEIRSILNENGIVFHTDSSNSDLKFLRNRVRSKIIPSLNEVFGSGTKEKWRQLSENASDSLLAIKTLLQHVLRPGLQEDDCGFRVDRKLLESLSEPVLKESILYVLEQVAGSTYFLTTKHLSQLVIFSGGSGYGEVVIHPEMGVRVVRSGNWLYFLKKTPATNLKIKGPGTYRSWFQEKFIFSQGSGENKFDNETNVLYLNEKRFDFPFQLSPVDFESDMAIHGGREIRDLQHFLKKQGIGKFERETMPALKHGHRVLWVPGFKKMVAPEETAMSADGIAVYFTIDMR